MTHVVATRDDESPGMLVSAERLAEVFRLQTHRIATLIADYSTHRSDQELSRSSTR